MTTTTKTPNQYATYNICTNKLKFFPDGRLPKEEYERFRKLGFITWHGSKCFAAAWSVSAIDLILEYVSEVQEDDRPDDVESRVERFEKYADSSERSADYAATRIENANTVRQLKSAQSSLERETETATHWHDRIAGAIAHANYKDRPDVIVRRIKGLETDLRKHSGWEKEFNSRVSLGWLASDFRDANGLSREIPSTDEIKTAYREYVESRREESRKYHTRWIDHLNARLEYERAYLEAVGGDPREKVAGVWIGDVIRYGKEECEVLSAGKVNLVIRYHGYQRQIGREDAGEIIRKAEGTPAKRTVRKAVAPEDGITKGSFVTWEIYLSFHKATFTSKCLKASPKTLIVEIPNDPAFDNYRKNHTDLKVDRKGTKLAEVVNA